MSDRLDKSKRALDEAAAQVSDDIQEHLLAIARTQAAIAAAEALEELVRWCKLTATGQDDERKQAGYVRRRSNTPAPSDRAWVRRLT